MNKDQLINIGLEIEKISDISDLCEKYEDWKEEVFQCVSNNKVILERCKILLHVLDTPYESQEEKIEKYRACIRKTVRFLQAKTAGEDQKISALETIIDNFGLYLQNMFGTTPENKATLQKDVLEQIVINNEFDVQHIMYAVIKALYPSARREVYQDIGYGADRYDIHIEEIDTVIELKCTRKDHSEKKLFRELGEDAFFYECSKLIIYVYDKLHVISDVDNFIKALERNEENAGKDIKVYVEQMKELI